MFDSGEGRNEVVLNRVAILHFGFIVATRDKSPGRGLFISHSDRTMKHRPSLAITRIEGIVILPGEVVEAKTVKPLSVVSTETAKPVQLRSGQVRVVR